MMCLGETWFVAAFHSAPIHDPGPKEFQCPVGVCVCKGASLHRLSEASTLPCRGMDFPGASCPVLIGGFSRPRDDQGETDLTAEARGEDSDCIRRWSGISSATGFCERRPWRTVGISRSFWTAALRLGRSTGGISKKARGVSGLSRIWHRKSGGWPCGGFFAG